MINLAADTQHGVANSFGIKSPWIRTPDQSVVRIELVVLFIKRRRHPVNARRDDFANDRFDRPARLHESDRQMIEQFGMTRHLPRRAEVFGRRDNPLADQVQPDSVNHHTSGQRIFTTADPPCEFQSATRLTFNFRRFVSND